MKKFFVTMCVVLLSVGAYAQEKGTFAVGAEAAYGSSSGFKRLAAGIKAQYNFTDPIRGEVGATYWMKKDHNTAFDVYANAHYLLKITDQFKVYPLAGVGYESSKSEDFTESVTVNGMTTTVLVPEVTSTDVFFTGGAGIQYDMTENFGFNAEYRFQTNVGSRSMFAAGIFYRF